MTVCRDVLFSVAFSVACNWSCLHLIKLPLQFTELCCVRTYCCYSVFFGKQSVLCDLLAAAAIYLGCAVSKPVFGTLAEWEHAATDGMTTCQPTL